jgi:hypothetical protein
MGKPFPCCCNCINCPDFTFGIQWSLLFCSLTNSSLLTFVSSTTGNTLAADLVALGVVSFNSGSMGAWSAGPTTRTVTVSLSSLLPSYVWNYTRNSDSASLQFTNPRVEITLSDNCSKVNVTQIDLITDETTFSIAILHARGSSTAPSSPNCGQLLTSPVATPAFAPGNVSSAIGTGSILIKKTAGAAVTCPP